MKRGCCILLAMVLLLGLCPMGAFAEEEDTVTAAGFYDIEEEADVTVTPESSGSAVEAVSANVDGTEGYETFYANSDKLSVSFPGTEGKQYLILLLEGADAVPTESNICYIDQASAGEDGDVSFLVFPKLPEQSGAMTLMITSNDGDFETKRMSLGYAVSGTYDRQPYILGDVTGDQSVNISDASAILSHILKTEVLTGDAYLAADVDLNGTVNIQDASHILQYILKNIKDFSEVQAK